MNSPITKRQKIAIASICAMLSILFASYVSYQWSVTKKENQEKERIKINLRLLDRSIYPELTTAETNISKETITLSFGDKFNQLTPEAKYAVLGYYRDVLDTIAEDANTFTIYGQMIHGQPLVYLNQNNLYSKDGDRLVVGASVDEQEDILFAELKEFEGEEQQTSIQPAKKKQYSDGHCNALYGKAKSDCLMTVMNVHCGQYMGLNGQEPQYVKMESCIREHISPDNEFE